MRRVATILSGSACCVYGLTFVSHFYGARRSVGYVPFNSETLVTGKLFEDIREAVHAVADPAQLRRDRGDEPLRADRLRRAAAAAAEGDQRRAHHRHRRAGLRRADPCRGQGRAGRRHAGLCPRGGRGRPGRRRRGRARRPADGDAARRDVPGRPGGDRPAAGADGPGRRPGGARAASGASSTPRSTAPRSPRSTPSTPPRSASSRRRAGPIVGSAPGRARRHRRLARGRSATRCGVPGATSRTRPRTRSSPRSTAPWRRRRSRARITVSGYEGSELLVARLLVESGADVPYVGTACPRTRWSEPDRDWLEAQGTRRQVPRLARGGPRRACEALEARTSPSARRRWCRRPRRRGIPALYFTNLISARPLMGPAGAGVAGRGRQRRHRQPRAAWPRCAPSSRASAPATPPASGQDTPADRPEFRDEDAARQRRQARAPSAAQRRRRSI